MGGLKRRRLTKLQPQKSNLNTFFGRQWAREKEVEDVEDITFKQVKKKTLELER